MELSGDEKRIRALFSELRFDDEHIVPRFDLLVNRADIGMVRQQRRFNVSLAWAAVVICTIAALLWWSTARLRQPTSSPIVVKSPSAAESGSLPTTTEAPEKTIATLQHRTSHASKRSRINHAQLVARRLAARRQAEALAANKKALEDAKAISTWASPTSSLLSSSTSEVLTSLPQLNENANQLKSFLPSSSN